MDEKSGHEENAQHQPRDEHGHFAAKARTGPASSAHPLADSLLPHGVSIDHKADDNTLLDVHLGNPLRRIQQLLEDIKKQKAFSFTLKGSLGIAGIVLVLSTFGIFGGSRVLCAKGVQSHIGVLRQLQIAEESKPFLVERAQLIWSALTGGSVDTSVKNRVVLIKADQSVLHVTGSSVPLHPDPEARQVIITGDYDSCSQTVTIKTPQSIQSL